MRKRKNTNTAYELRENQLAFLLAFLALHRIYLRRLRMPLHFLCYTLLREISHVVMIFKKDYSSHSVLFHIKIMENSKVCDFFIKN